MGSVPNTNNPVPVSSVMREASSADVSRDEEDILLLNIDQSVDDSLPLAVAEEKGRLNVWVSPDAVIVKSVPVVDVERVWVEPV